MPDRVERLREAAQARHEATLRRAEDTVRRLTSQGGVVTFRGVAEEAGVSRSWLYRQSELREQIDRLRESSSTRTPTVPQAERTTTESLRQQLRTYRAELARLRDENQALREQLAHHLGSARAVAVTKR